MTYLKTLIGINSLNTKQFPESFSLTPVKLGSFIGGEFSPQKRKEQFMIVAYLCVSKFKELYDLRYESNKLQYMP